MSELHPVVPRENDERVGDVIFVHGLGGDYQRTWAVKGDPDDCWPKRLGEDIPHIGVWSLQYEAAPSAFVGSAMALVFLARNVLEALRAQGIGRKPLIFITHSLGGLLVKQMLHTASESTNQEWKAILEQTKAVIFFATPHAGADLATIVSQLSPLLRLTSLPKELETEDPRLLELDNWYRDQVQTQGIQTLAYCETQRTSILPGVRRIIVSSRSANPFIPHVEPIPLARNHLTICKLGREDIATYTNVRDFVSRNLAERYRVRGRIISPVDGYGLAGAVVKIAVGETIVRSMTDQEGNFEIFLDRRSERLTLLASGKTAETRLSTFLDAEWDQMIEKVLSLELKPDIEIEGTVVWCGSESPITRARSIPIQDAEICIDILGDKEPSRRTGEDGFFRISCPRTAEPRFSLCVSAPNAFTAIFPVDHDASAMEVMLPLARSCTTSLHRTLLLQSICDDVELRFLRVEGGTFRLGPDDEGAVCEVSVEDFLISQYPITCQQFSVFLQQRPDIEPKGWPRRLYAEGRAHYPATDVTWYEAILFCDWLTEQTGVRHRLPTEAEWERTASGPSGTRTYPWGFDEDFKKRCNSRLSWGQTESGRATVVDAYPLGRSPFGAWDLVGNVLEWTNSLYQPYPYVPDDGREDQVAPGSRVARGGSFQSRIDEVTCAKRHPADPNQLAPWIGFRVVRELTKEELR